jgi:hypothetical protein
LLMGFLSLFVVNVQAQPQPPHEYDVKAAFLYNFIKYVEWPADAFASDTSAIILGVVGSDPWDGKLRDNLRGRTVSGRRIVFRHFPDLPSVRKCHVLFFAADAAGADPTDLEAALTTKSCLTVGETEGFITRGGMIGFVVNNRKLRFEVNLRAATCAGVKISSKLLHLAQTVLRAEYDGTR